MRLFIIIFLSVTSFVSKAQQTLSIKVAGGENRTPVSASVLIKGTTKGYSTDSTGKTSISFVANGHYTLIISAVGFEEKETKLTIPYSSDTLEIELESTEHEMEEIIIQSTRTSRTARKHRHPGAANFCHLR